MMHGKEGTGESQAEASGVTPGLNPDAPVFNAYQSTAEQPVEQEVDWLQP